MPSEIQALGKKSHSTRETINVHSSLFSPVVSKRFHYFHDSVHLCMGLCFFVICMKHDIAKIIKYVGMTEANTLKFGKGHFE